MNAYEILGISPGTSQEEIAKAYKKMALKYHPDRNRGREEWAKKKFIEVGEAYQSLTSSSSRPGVSRKKFQFSNKPGSDKFKEFEEMLREVREDLDNVENNLNESKENLNRERERVQNEAIRNMEENFSLAGVSSSDLDSSLWSPYGDWKEKVRNSIDSSLELFLSNMRIAISNAKWDKANNSGFKQGDNTQSDFSNKNFSPNNSGSTGEKKPFSTQGDEITRLKREIKYNKDYISKTPHEDEKEKCRKIVAKLEEKLRKLQQTTQSNSNSSSSDFEEINNDNKKETGNKKDNKDEKIKKLEDEIEQLKKSGEGRWNSWQKKADEKKIAEKEKELSELKKDNKKNDTDDELNEQLINELINEIERLRGESKNLKDEKDELAKKVNRLEKTVERLERETEELRKEIEELKESKDDSISDEHRTYMINRKNEELKNNQAMIEKLKGIINPRSESSPNPSSDSEFPTGWVVGGAVLLSVIGLVSFLIIRRNNKVKKILKSKAKIKIKEKGA